MRCIDCIYCHKFPKEVVEEIGHNYYYICMIPFFLGEPDYRRQTCVVDAQVQLATSEGVKEKIKCKYFTPYHA